MRKLRQFSGAIVLTLTFAAYGFAGIIGCPPEAPPPPAPSSSLAASIVLALVQIAVH